MSARAYQFDTLRRVRGAVPQTVFAQAYADAAAWLEQNPGYDASTAILKATDHLPETTARLAALAFLESFGAWIGNDEGVLMLCFAADFARTDRLQGGAQWFSGEVGCVYCDGNGNDGFAICVVCDGSGLIGLLESIDAEDVEPARFLEGAE